jgi:hemolysin III
MVEPAKTWNAAENASGLATSEPVRPRLRGVLHQAGFVVACFVGIAFIGAVDGRRLVAAAVFATSAATMLGASTLYHRITWSARARPWMRRLDHAGIYLLIAGTYTPVGLLSLHGGVQQVVLAVAWSGVAVAIVVKLVWVHAPKWLSVAFGVTLGWVGVAAMPQLVGTAGPAAVALLAAGGVAYTAGALVYARQRPDPVPSVFGYHEVFHALTLVALACQYVAIAFFVVRVG